MNRRPAWTGCWRTRPEPGRGPAYRQRGRIRYFGHACLVLQTPEAAIITDPWISADRTAAGRFTYWDLPDHIDLALITHGHQDHVVLETLLQLRGRVRRRRGAAVVAGQPRATRRWASSFLTLGLPVVEVDDFAEVEFPGGKVIATPFLGEHADLDIRAKTTYCVRLAGRTIFVGADSSGIDPGLYRYMRDHVGPVDMAFLGMECAGAPLTWLYQALLTRPVTKKMSDSRTLSGSNAAAGRRDHDGAGGRRSLCVRDGRRDLAGRAHHGHQLQGGLLPAQAGR